MGHINDKKYCLRSQYEVNILVRRVTKKENVTFALTNGTPLSRRGTIIDRPFA